MIQRFKRDMSSLSSLYSFVCNALSAYGAGEADCFAVNLALEELFTNMVKYNRDTREDIPVSIDREGDRVIVLIADKADKPFDITRHATPDIRMPLAGRTRGGLGLHLVRKVVEDLKYEYVNGENRISFTKLIT